MVKVFEVALKEDETDSDSGLSIDDNFKKIREIEAGQHVQFRAERERFIRVRKSACRSTDEARDAGVEKALTEEKVERKAGGEIIPKQRSIQR
ncbi:hypothetical protein COP2_039502 [Malus domestica]